MLRVKSLSGLYVLLSLIAGQSIFCTAADARVEFEPLTAAVGAFPAPPAGDGRGMLELLQLHDKTAGEASFGKPGTLSGNSFYVAYDNEQSTVYVPTLAGKTYVVDRFTQETVNSFSTIEGGRVARLTPEKDMVLVLSGKQLAGYRTHTGEQIFKTAVGGNAMVIDPSGTDVYVGGNMNKHITEISLPAGKIVHTYPIAGSGDLAWIDKKIFSANMKTGVMSVLNTESGKITRIKTPEKDPHFSYHDIGAAKAGFMQIVAVPDRHLVYAAGFSGHILKFSSSKNTYLGEVAVKVNSKGPNKLSGLVLLKNGRVALTTIENLHETVEVDMESARIIRTFPQVASNRWVVAQG
ncbi:MAG: hypothetical protein PVJ39_13355 [Gammaproteobacteria bacterium]|jgi:hypothetical protein